MSENMSSVFKKAENDIKKLIQTDIQKKGLIKTGAMIQSIDPIFRMEGSNVVVEVGAVYYFKFQDDGTRYITARDITNDVINSKAFQDIIEYVMYYWMEKRTNDMLVKLGNKNKNIKIR